MAVKKGSYGRKLAAASPKSRVPHGAIPRKSNFVLGGLAGMTATYFVHPLNLVKNRMQLSGEGGMVRENKTSFHAIARVVRNEGFVGLYKGLSAGFLHQATYSATRLGIYQSLLDHSSFDGRFPGLLMKLGMGMTAGAIGSFIGTPAEIALTRMTSDGRLPPAERRAYSNVFNALFRISREEGVLTLWRGCGPTMVRAMVVNAAQLGTYSHAKQLLLYYDCFSDNMICHFCASMMSGLVTTIVSMPVDIAKTRLQNMKTVNGKPEYSGSVDVLSKLIRNEGFFSLWKGFTPYYSRLGPHTVLTFIFLEQFRQLYYSYSRGSGGGSVMTG